MSNAPEVFTTDPSEAIEVDHGVAKHVEPELFGIPPFGIVAIAMSVLILIAIFGAKVHKTIGAGLDGRIAAIRENLDEAKKLRAEAEALRAEYTAKIAGAEKDAEAMLETARGEADAIVIKAEADAVAMVARRKQMAEDKIASAERSAIAEVRETAAVVATGAASSLIAKKHDAAADKKLADELIGGI
ncbi:hypothetical protein [Altererythrobacter sp. ZODW24]|uniref:F0F1 ATP synthase subunit B family protein n=1 Tax=Altererythrobacter sp. ZODW24 TaxID=2185142 RepID=UPI000DF753F2|nr:hypothetical protein [Altererythrobacter sp. ZODW24]